MQTFDVNGELCKLGLLLSLQKNNICIKCIWYTYTFTYTNTYTHTNTYTYTYTYTNTNTHIYIYKYKFIHIYIHIYIYKYIYKYIHIYICFPVLKEMTFRVFTRPWAPRWSIPAPWLWSCTSSVSLGFPWVGWVGYEGFISRKILTSGNLLHSYRSPIESSLIYPLIACWFSSSLCKRLPEGICKWMRTGSFLWSFHHVLDLEMGIIQSKFVTENQRSPLGCQRCSMLVSTLSHPWLGWSGWYP